MRQSKIQVKPKTKFSEFDNLMRLENFLGATDDYVGVFSFGKIVEEDELSIYPDKGVVELNKFGVQNYYIPKSIGGNFENGLELFLLMRLISRRDLTLAIGHGKTFLGSLPVWIAGSDSQQEMVKEIVRSGQKISLGLTEKSHGSDITANELEATPCYENCYLLNGTKWSINNIHGDNITILAKTANSFTVRNYSLFFIDKSKYPSDKMEYHNLKPVGLRSADLGSIKINNLKVDESTLVGEVGKGLDTTLKTLQVTRFMCNAFSLGAIDTCLRVGVQFLKERKLYGDFAINIPVVKQQILNITADVLLCDFFSVSVARILHLLPAELSLLSAVSKSTVPVIVDEDIYQLSLLMGARSLFRNDFAAGIFQKMKRDHLIIPIFDGNTAVNQQYIISQFQSMINSCQENHPNFDHYYEAIYSLDIPLESIDVTKLDLINRNKCFVKESLWKAKSILEERKVESRKDNMLYNYCLRLIRIWTELDNVILENEENLLSTYSIPPIFFKYAKQFGLLYLGSTCLNIWINNEEKEGSAIFNKSWILLCLNRLLQRLGVEDFLNLTNLNNEVIGELIELVDDKKLISFLNFNIK